MTTVKNKKRIWEIDAVRGFCILFVILIHFLFDIENFLGIMPPLKNIFDIIQNYGGIIFIFISGICVFLGSKNFKRGIIVFLCGLIITAATWIYDPDYIIVFGILHFLGISMMLAPLLKKLNNISLMIIGLLIILFGYIALPSLTPSKFPGLFAFGFYSEEFESADYFPFIPNLGFFMLGIAAGRKFYIDKKTLFPNFPSDNIIIRFFSFCGRHSLWIYLIHQPVLMGIIEILQF
ncbi:MAG: DUF1624 domain-containing protein [Clostridiales bacterium]|jgi:uncharacterized membrane protein|nr:DUF1624 domain-containing protein [Clostridiales bacterium]